MSFRVLSAGIFSCIQDLGRYGYMHRGVTPSGAMDEYAYLWSQTLLNQESINALELMVGLKLQALWDMEIAITGADLDFKLNDISCKTWKTFHIQKGDLLSFSKRQAGQRAYLAVKGGFKSEKKYGSYATTLKEGIGKKLQRMDILKAESFFFQKSEIRKVKQVYLPTYSNRLTLRLMLTYQEEYFLEEVKKKFFTSEYEVTLQSDRMGFKLKGEAVVPTEGGIISEGIAFGSVQIPPDGQPIILLKERQTIGGYPKIGTVLAEDCFKLAQLPVGGKVYFVVEKSVISLTKENEMGESMEF